MKNAFMIFALVMVSAVSSADAVVGRSTYNNVTTTARAGNAATPTAAYNYNYMYPYMNNQMRTAMNPGGVSPSRSSNPINTVVKTDSTNNTRRVVPRGGTARSASTATVAPTIARGAQMPATSSNNTNNNNWRRVVARANMVRNANVRSATRGDASNTSLIAANAAANPDTSKNLTSSRCLADYTECMNGYCQRENTAYNRCYCSSKLAQIDSEYQPAINNLINQMVTMRGQNQWSEKEMNEYWDTMIGQYTGDNSWVKLDNALNIDWAGLESRVRGQQAFATGHEYCVQHLRGCYYMAANLRDAYRSEIARDCQTYEQSLQKIKNAAESLVEAYK